MKPSLLWAGTFIAGLLSWQGAQGAGVDQAVLLAAPAEPTQWLSHGRTWSEQRYSPLTDINAESVNKLGLAWSIDLDNNRGLEATPLYSDGVLYTSLSWSRVLAVDASSGKILWSFDPQVNKAKGRHACCDAVNRGVALWNGKVYVGTLDGRLIALDAKTGKPVWTEQTTDNSQPYTITAAPRIVKGMVMIGNGGAEFGVRGYFSAYDAETGEMKWRFYTVPAAPSKPVEHPELAEAAKTWSEQTDWSLGGGGTAWDSMAYDPELDLLYVGTGNGSPWNREVRSPGGGDNLFLSSILAIRPDTGKLVWYYQVNPGDTWDFTATQHMILAELEIAGKERKVLMQAPKNGFFYVLDRATGELLSAEKFGKVTWAERIDLATGRPVEVPGARYEKEPVVLWPSPFGAHNWHPMSFNPQTGLVYIPYQEVPGTYSNEGKSFVRREAFNTGSGSSEILELPREYTAGALVAWDPVKQAAAWRVEYPNHWNGGTLSTAGNLVFQGTAAGEFAAYSADAGAKLWSFDAQTGVIAAPMTYQHQGEQYVALMAGWGGSAALFGGDAAVATGVRNVSRMLVFKLDASTSLPTLSEPVKADAGRVPQPVLAAEQDIAQGLQLYSQYCAVCHGTGVVGGGVLPDLRYSSSAIRDSYQAILRGGALEPLGMPNFAHSLDETQVNNLLLYVMKREYDTHTQAMQPAQE
ncbi:PQQ-dependent dehydrogenase, methanol/ethanol family [Halopseudomonas pelagia]|uniref:PQQ-dependent dehydrogenase, methanol/ethanol family n=1 Tax=Halopseudomonas pelagia TaxID=553151 RepID=A0AA92EM24_9GAMM|nr:PQQ-dependent dehydrogenase, methanol/ethanol family [Halopseudomonas pelagia]PCC97810.1 PQQ-dependent dehydrogenase, methanol/ethanol family [Halopseudomonas pelagia]QFY57342.1 PQQ-dependent dehydrogenase, methanol/ethanol family [Halopseudomonas pelagia]